MTATSAAALAGTLTLALASCSSQPTAGSPAQVADTITRAVYADDLDTTIGSFDDATKRTITRSELGDLSDRMHALGTLKAVTEKTGDPDTGRYEFEAAFTGGTMLVQIRFDPSGRVGAYRVLTLDASSPPTPSTQG